VLARHDPRDVVEVLLEQILELEHRLSRWTAGVWRHIGTLGRRLDRTIHVRVPPIGTRPMSWPVAGLWMSLKRCVGLDHRPDVDARVCAVA